MLAVKGHVRNGRLVVDEPTDLPEGTEIELYSDDDMEEERAELEASLERGASDFASGRIVTASEVLAKLEARR